MPYVSTAQRGKFHILEKQGKISNATVSEFDQASKGLKLPRHAAHTIRKHLKQRMGGY